VVAVERGGVLVATPVGERRAAGPALVVGDWVALDDEDRVVAVVERWSSLGRRDPDHGHQVLAANVDVVLVVAPVDRLSLARIERELVAAWDSGARPVVVVTKSDLAQPDLVDGVRRRLDSVDVVVTSSVEGSGVDEVARLLGPPVTAVLLGPSGAGKSTLLNALLGEERLATGAVRDGDARGRHTTTSRRLLAVPSGGSVIDMPGLRSLGLDVDAGSLAAAFSDIDELAEGCRFADCSHTVEPGCAVAAAVDAGRLDPARLASHRKLLREIRREALQVDPVARKEQLRVWKQRYKEGRARSREKHR
jgi:ribosome biogenesis GTPase